MSHYDYEISKSLSAIDPPFASLIMAAMRKADTANAILLGQAFPEIGFEFNQRYWAPGGLLPTDHPRPEPPTSH